MNVTLCSIFRDSTEYVGRYLSQITRLRLAGVDVRLAMAEGDSSDGTYEALEMALRPGDFLMKVDHGGPKFHSVDHPDRWANIAKVVTALIGKVSDPGDALIWVESDLVWEPEAMVDLLASLDEVPAVAPMVYAQDTARFYDYWGFRKDGQPFNMWPPYWPGMSSAGEQRLIKIDSCGSCFVVDRAMFPELASWDGVWPFRAGGKLWLDPRVEVRHP